MSTPTTIRYSTRGGGVQNRIDTLETQSSSGSTPEPQRLPHTDRSSAAVSELARFKHRRRPLQQRSRLEATTAVTTGGIVESQHPVSVVKKDVPQPQPPAATKTSSTTTVTQQASVIRRNRLGLRHGLSSNDAMSIDTSTTPQTTSSTTIAASVQSAPPIRTSSTAAATMKISQLSPAILSQKSHQQQQHSLNNGGGYTSSGGESHTSSSCASHASNGPLHSLRHGTARVARSHNKRIPTNTTAAAAAAPETSLQRTPIVSNTTFATAPESFERRASSSSATLQLPLRRPLRQQFLHPFKRPRPRRDCTRPSGRSSCAPRRRAARVRYLVLDPPPQPQPQPQPHHSHSRNLRQLPTEPLTLQSLALRRQSRQAPNWLLPPQRLQLVTACRHCTGKSPRSKARVPRWMSIRLLRLGTSRRFRIH
jgi:hypothetical protein